MHKTIEVEILLAPGCESAEEVVAMVERAQKDLGNVRIVKKLISSFEDAHAQRFLGSPSIRVNGVDIEPGAGQRSDFSLG